MINAGRNQRESLAKPRRDEETFLSFASSRLRVSPGTSPRRAEKLRLQNPGTVDQLKDKYKKGLTAARKGRSRDDLRLRATYETDLWLFQKWAYRVGKGWYGFALGNVPYVWRLILDEFLEWVEKQRPDFEIRQVKMKFDRLRLYLGTKNAVLIRDEHIRSEISKLENLLSLRPDAAAPIRSARKTRQSVRKK